MAGPTDSPTWGELAPAAWGLAPRLPPCSQLSSVTWDLGVVWAVAEGRAPGLTGVEVQLDS